MCSWLPTNCSLECFLAEKQCLCAMNWFFLLKKQCLCAMHFLADSSRESERKYRFNSALGLEIILYVGGTGIEINTMGPN